MSQHYNYNGRDTWRPSRDQDPPPPSYPYPGPPDPPRKEGPPKTRDEFFETLGSASGWATVPIPRWALPHLLDLASLWFHRGGSLRQLLDAFEKGSMRQMLDAYDKGKLGGAAAAAGGGKDEDAVDSKEVKRLLEAILANQNGAAVAAGASAKAVATASGAGPSTAAATPAAAGPANKKKGRTPKTKTSVPEEDDIPPSPNRFAALEEDPAKSSWVLPAGLKARMMCALADQLEKALQQPALSGAGEPALATAITKVLKAFVETKSSTRGAKWKHVHTVYDCLMPAAQARKTGDTPTQLLAAMAAYIAAQVVGANPAV